MLHFSLSRSLLRPLTVRRTPTLGNLGVLVHFRKMATENTPAFNRVLYTPLAEIDPEVKNIIDKETWRQFSGLELIASENLTSLAAMEANGSILTNKYSEGLPGARYYGGNEYIDELEILCRKRALQAFNLDPEKWGVNVQPYSGSHSSFAALTALIQPQDRLMGLGLPDGGHLTHGYYTAKKKMTASSIYFQSFPYAIDPSTQLIDYDGLRKQAKIFKPRLIICGASAYPRDWDYKTLRAICDGEGAYLMADMAHTSGLIAAQELNSPFDYCDVVTTTTHKTLRGPRAGLIFFRKDGANYEDLEKRVNEAVFPACQGGPHNNTIAAVATALLQVSQPEFKEYARQVIANARTLGSALHEYGYKLQTGGTDNHLVLWDLRPLGLTGSKVEKVCDLLGITINKNAVSGDASALAPGGIRLGTSALTSRDMKEEDIKIVASFLHRAVQLSILLQKEAGTKMIKDFVRVATVESKGKVGAKMVKELRQEVVTFARNWPLPGVDVTKLQRPAGIEEDF
ncbi:serine hydroxymethyltransferase-domain-containing protein [Pisolithus marmoratus]|nr:serine hydroxymethyltransferase-domain-containing protein [Pisolithus marmoratus]